MRQAVSIQVDGQTVSAREGQSVAAALIDAGWSSFSPNAKTGAPLAPYCIMGVCFGCLCEIDGRPGVQACLVPVSEGMAVRLGSVSSE